MWYFAIIAASCIGMAAILSHKDRELEGRRPCRLVHVTREAFDRVIAGVWRRVVRVTSHAWHASMEALRVAAVATWKGAHAVVVAVPVVARACVRRLRAVARAVQRRLAHPHAFHHHHGHLSSAVEQPFCKR